MLADNCTAVQFFLVFGTVGGRTNLTQYNDTDGCSARPWTRPNVPGRSKGAGMCAMNSRIFGLCSTRRAAVTSATISPVGIEMATVSTPAGAAPLGSLLLPEMKVASAENSRQLEKRFAFLWSSAHRLLPTSAALANHMIASMMQLARSSRAQLPQQVLDFICEDCGGLLVPSVSADVRVVPQSRQSPANRRLARQQRRAQLQNGSNGPRLVREALSTLVRVTCHRCRHANDRPGASVVHKAKNKKRTREEEEETVSGDHAAPEAKKLKAEGAEAAKSVEVKSAPPAAAAAAPSEVKAATTSVFAPPPSPPRKLLDGPKRKKKKKKPQPDAAVVAVKNSLGSFLQGLKARK
ncbi:hypothetical protein PHYPSEUDO_012715 [Phytophthora pseudosyringae]|uniref:Uncharacterized protein n=1 Tax=Phytophthora pseudosyringae TaxID=221518 RepID=A0A8T1W3Y7_9STRA|nr:hypothetical protein PHYPSEUDO_012715 [Phytophthora pseudosyringae]